MSDEGLETKGTRERPSDYATAIGMLLGHEPADVQQAINKLRMARMCLECDREVQKKGGEPLPHTKGCLFAPRLSKAQRQAAKRRAAVLAFLAAKAEAYATGGATYDDTCFRTADAAAATGLAALEADAILVELRDEGFAEYHRPHDAPTYWRATNKARGATRPT